MGKIIGENSERWITLKELKTYTTLSESTIRKYIGEGRLIVSKATGKLLFKKDNVDDFLMGEIDEKSEK